MVLKLMKFDQFIMVWHELFPIHKHGCRKGGRDLKALGKRAIFIVLSGKNQISPLLAPHTTTFRKLHQCPPE